MLGSASRASSTASTSSKLGNKLGKDSGNNRHKSSVALDESLEGSDEEGDAFKDFNYNT